MACIGDRVVRRYTLFESDFMKRFLLVSKYAFYPPHWKAFVEICGSYNVEGSIISESPPTLPDVHKQLGWIGPEEAKKEACSPQIFHVPEVGRRKQKAWFKKTLERINPDSIWIQQEPTDALTLSTLKYFRNNDCVNIVCSVCENIFKDGSWKKKFECRRLWPRLNGLLATAQTSIDGVREAGMPKTVPAQTLVAGMEGPPESVSKLQIPVDLEHKRFVVGFAGRICEEKGWKVLLHALANLHDHCCVVLAGSGPQDQLLTDWIREKKLHDRVVPLGLLPKDKLWQFYHSVDCLVLPSLTLPRWKEQFGGVLADAMAMGVPIVGSDSGSIPEVVGPAGLIVPEADVQALAAAIRRMDQEPELHRKFSQAGRRRFLEEFSIAAYAKKIATSLNLPHRATKSVAA